MTANSQICLIMYALLIPGVICYFTAKYAERTRMALCWKGLCTAVILLASVYVRQAQPDLSRAVSAGLLFGLLGDIVIAFSLPAGMLLFGMGHLAYLKAFFKPEAFIAPGLLIFVLCTVIVYRLYKKSGIDLGKLLVPVCLYALVILLMLTAALAAPAAFGVRGWYVALAGAMFTVSDAMLARSIFLSSSRTWDIISLSCYYFGQSLFVVAVAAL